MLRVLTVLLLISLVLPAFLAAENCESLASGSPEAAVEYLESAEPKTLPCVRMAFQQIGRSQAETAIPILVKLLGYKRPLNETEKHGISFRGKGAEEMYPAIRSLAAFGPKAEPTVIDFISRNEDEGEIERQNALHVLVLIRHGGILKLIQDLHQKSLLLAGTVEGDALLSAAKQLVRDWCDSEIKPQCENAMNP